MKHALLFLQRSPATSLGLTILGENFAYVTAFFFFFFNPTIMVVTFRLRGWCMLGVFLSQAFTRLRYDCQDLLSPRDGMHIICAQTRPGFILSPEFF